MKHDYDHRQLRALCYTASLAPASHLIPKVTASIAGSGSWIAPLIALPVILIFVLLLSGLMNMRRDGEGLGELILRTGGSGFGRRSEKAHRSVPGKLFCGRGRRQADWFCGRRMLG